MGLIFLFACGPGANTETTSASSGADTGEPTGAGTDTGGTATPTSGASSSTSGATTSGATTTTGETGETSSTTGEDTGSSTDASSSTTGPVNPCDACGPGQLCKQFFDGFCDNFNGAECLDNPDGCVPPAEGELCPPECVELCDGYFCDVTMCSGEIPGALHCYGL